MAGLLRALVVDDDAVVRTAAEEILQRFGFLVTTAADHASGLRALDESPGFDLCLLDVVLPDGNGIALVEEIRRRPALLRTAVITMSGRREQQIVVAAFAAGADDFIHKPASGEELVVRSQLAVRRRRQSSALDAKVSERRELTALFCDVRGFTAMTGTLDPEWVVEVLNGLFDRLVADVEGQGGVVDKFLGDGLLAFFGLGTNLGEAKELGAIRAALSMVASTTAYGRESLVLEGRELGVGIGIASGEVVVAPVGSRSLRQVTAIGDAVNLASRLQAIAREGEILVCQRTFDRVSDVAVHAGGRVVDIKGVTGSPTIFPIVGVRAQVA